MNFVPLVAMGLLVYAIINTLKQASAKNWNAVVTQVIVWVAGVVVILLVAQTQFAEGVSVNGIALTKLDFWSALFVGLIASSIGSFGNDLKKAFDNTDSAMVPPLLPSSSSTTATSRPG